MLISCLLHAVVWNQRCGCAWDCRLSYCSVVPALWMCMKQQVELGPIFHLFSSVISDAHTHMPNMVGFIPLHCWFFRPQGNHAWAIGCMCSSGMRVVAHAIMQLHCSVLVRDSDSQQPEKALVCMVAIWRQMHWVARPRSTVCSAQHVVGNCVPSLLHTTSVQLLRVNQGWKPR